MGDFVKWLSDKALMLVGGGFLKGYRGRIMGVMAVVGGFVTLVVGWMTGDFDLVTMLDKVADLPWGNLAVIGAGLFGLAAVDHKE